MQAKKSELSEKQLAVSTKQGRLLFRVILRRFGTLQKALSRRLPDLGAEFFPNFHPIKAASLAKRLQAFGVGSKGFDSVGRCRRLTST